MDLVIPQCFLCGQLLHVVKNIVVAFNWYFGLSFDCVCCCVYREKSFWEVLVACSPKLGNQRRQAQ